MEFVNLKTQEKYNVLSMDDFEAKLQAWKLAEIFRLSHNHRIVQLKLVLQLEHKVNKGITFPSTFVYQYLRSIKARFDHDKCYIFTRWFTVSERRNLYQAELVYHFPSSNIQDNLYVEERYLKDRYIMIDDQKRMEIDIEQINSSLFLPTMVPVNWLEHGYKMYNGHEEENMVYTLNI